MELAYREAYTDILRKEIVPATGCTEPISIAYCAAKAHEVLGMQPTAVTVSVSGNILKNVKSVVVPNTNGLKGIRAAVAAGIVCGDAGKGMQVISEVSPEQRAAVSHFMETIRIDVSCAETDCAIYISVTLYARTSYSRVVIANSHSNIVEIMKNGEALLKRPIVAQSEDSLTDYSCLNLHDIVAFADHVDLSLVQDLLDLQIEYNTAVCEEGLSHDYGANIGRIILSESESDAMTIARAYAAAGSEARMNGCELPVAVICGSGNQGIAASIPIICFAKQYQVPKERMYRALLVSDLLTVFQRACIGRLPSYCGAISAGCAAGAGIAYLLGGDETAVAQTLVNSVTMIFGTACDGAKPSCTAKVASAIETGMLGYRIYLHQKKCCSEGNAVAPNADETIRNIGRIASEGLTEPDQTIIGILQQDCK